MAADLLGVHLRATNTNQPSFLIVHNFLMPKEAKSVPCQQRSVCGSAWLRQLPLGRFAAGSLCLSDAVAFFCGCNWIKLTSHCVCVALLTPLLTWQWTTLCSWIFIITCGSLRHQLSRRSNDFVNSSGFQLYPTGRNYCSMTKRHKDPTLFEEIRVVLVCASL